VEKPDASLAKQLYKTGRYFWNTGTFAWSLNTLRTALQQFAPQLYKGLETIRQKWQANGRNTDIKDVYETLPYISIDYALMEEAGDVLVVRGEFQRIDMGDLNALAQIWPVDEHQTAGMGKWLSHNSKGNIVYSPQRLVALVGVQDTVVVVTDDVVLVCPKEQSQAVRELVEELKISKREQYL
jgi:mannose-1-phosphate guanylyltransferase